MLYPHIKNNIHSHQPKVAGVDENVQDEAVSSLLVID